MYTYPIWPRVLASAALILITLSAIAIAVNVKSIRDDVHQIRQNTCTSGISAYQPNGKITTAGCTP